jgi:hypothetical protein
VEAIYAQFNLYKELSLQRNIPRKTRKNGPTGSVRPPQDHLIGYLWEGVHINNETLRCNTIGSTVYNGIRAPPKAEELTIDQSSV